MLQLLGKTVLALAITLLAAIVYWCVVPPHYCNSIQFSGVVQESTPSERCLLVHVRIRTLPYPRSTLLL
jgi:hypothetical protein